jgi:hypothetical protein
VGPRDGLQNEAVTLTPEVRAELVNGLAGAGLPRIEAVSFVNPAKVPAMAGPEEVVELIARRDGIEFGKLNVTSLLAKVDISKGHLVVKKFDTKSEDGEIHVDFDMTLAQAIDESTVTGCLRFTGSQALLKRDARTHAAISTTGAPLGPDNLYHILLDGKVKEMRRLGKVCGEAAAGGDSNDGTPSRPNLTIQPADQVNPPADAPAPAFTPPVPDAAVTVPVPGPGSEQKLGSANGNGSGSAGSGSAMPPPPGTPAVGEPPPPPNGGSANPVPEGIR